MKMDSGGASLIGSTGCMGISSESPAISTQQQLFDNTQHRQQSFQADSTNALLLEQQRITATGHLLHHQENEQAETQKPPAQQQSATSFQTTIDISQHPQTISAVPSTQPPSTGKQATSAQAEEVYQYILDLTVAAKRERALLELSRRRESFADLAPILWHSFGVVTAILQEIVSIYPHLSPPTLTSVASNRVCNALALLQCVASHPDTRQHFLNAHIPLFLYPFLNTVSVSRPFEYLRLTSLGVIGALVKVDDHEVIGFLLQTEIISLCLRIMEMGSELSKTVATFIVQKILLDELGLRYVCATAERFYALSSVLGGMVQNLVDQPSPRLVKHIVKCYLRLADNQRAREALKRCLPTALRQGPLLNVVKEDPTTKQNIATLIDLVDNAPNGPLFDIASAADVLSAAQQKHKLQQQVLQQNLKLV